MSRLVVITHFFEILENKSIYLVNNKFTCAYFLKSEIMMR